MRLGVRDAWQARPAEGPLDEIPPTMTATVIDETGGPGVLHSASVPVPTSTGAEFVVRVVAAGVNPIDATTRAGAGSSAAISDYPAVLGQDFSGVVVRSPYEAHPLRPGTEVYGLVPVPRYSGSYAQYVTVPSLSLARKPATLSHVEAAAVPVAALTAWGMVVELAKAHDGQRILVHAGGGGVGHFAVQFAKYFGAHVTATGSTRNLEWLRELGAAVAIDYTTTRFEDVIGEVDAVIDLVGNTQDATGSRSLQVLRPGGLIVNAPTGSWPTIIDDAREAGVRATTYSVAPDGDTLSTITRLLESGDVKVFVDGVFDLDAAASAHAALEDGHTRGKLVLKVADS
jgi:NADPH:quinone reductase-like Zn-dependent oxidoreductase